MRKPTSKIIKIPNSHSFISVKSFGGIGGIENGYRRNIETAFVDGPVSVILIGDHTREVRKILKSTKSSYLSTRSWFTKMEMEWGSRWSENSSIENWRLLDEIV